VISAGQVLHTDLVPLVNTEYQDGAGEGSMHLPQPPALIVTGHHQHTSLALCNVQHEGHNMSDLSSAFTTGVLHGRPECRGTEPREG
jgi:hypothetical protein